MGHTVILRNKDSDPVKTKTPKELQFLRGVDTNYLQAIMSKNTFAFCWLQVNSSAFRLQLSTSLRNYPRPSDHLAAFQASPSFYMGMGGES